MIERADEEKDRAVDGQNELLVMPDRKCSDCLHSGETKYGNVCCNHPSSMYNTTSPCPEQCEFAQWA